MPKISVIITCYNYGEFIREAAESVFSQTFRDFEIIIVNDGSTDKRTLDALYDLKKEHPEIIILDQPNGGVANARNNGIKKAQGEYFLPLDADDKLHPEMLEKCLKFLEVDERLGFVYAYTRFFGNFNAVLIRPEYDFAQLLRRNFAVVSSLIRKKAWEEVGGYDENMKEGYEDWEFFIRLGKNGWFGKVLKKPLFFYREHGDSKNKEATLKHRSNVAYIQKKHSDLYEPERLEETRREWRERTILKYLKPGYYIGRLRMMFFILKRYGCGESVARLYRFFRNQS